MKNNTNFCTKGLKINKPEKKFITSPQELKEVKETLDKFAVLERMVKSITTF